LAFSFQFAPIEYCMRSLSGKAGWRSSAAAYWRLVVRDTGAQHQTLAVLVIGAQRDAVSVFPVLADALGAFGRRRELDVQVLQREVRSK